MSGTKTTATQVADDPFGSFAPFGGDITVEGAVARTGQVPIAAPVGQLGARSDQAMAQIITAQRVAVKRDIAEIRREARDLATTMGDGAFYFWETKNRDGTRGQVMGPSIDCAMAAIGVYGNCSIEAFPAQETADHWIFLARFVDYEKGVTVTRSFQQRKNQRAGKGMEVDRQMDISFQIGQSKASRNAVVAGLKWLTTEMVEAARSGLLTKIQKNPEGARKWLLDKISEIGVPLKWVEHAATRTAPQWTAPDMARLYGKVQSITDGMQNWREVFPDPANSGTTLEGDADEDAATPQTPRGTPRAAPVGDAPPAAAVKTAAPEPEADTAAAEPADVEFRE